MISGNAKRRPTFNLKSISLKKNMFGKRQNFNYDKIAYQFS